MKRVVYFYSSTGNNRFLAEHLGRDLECPVEELLPNQEAGTWMMFKSFFKIGTTPQPLKHQPKNFDKIYLCGPIWMGTLISPLRGFLKTYRNHIKELVFVTVCGSTPEQRNQKFGYEKVFSEVKKLGGCISKVDTVALSIALTLPKEKWNDSELIMQTRLSEKNFSGVFEQHYQEAMSISKTLIQ